MKLFSKNNHGSSIGVTLLIIAIIALGFFIFRSISDEETIDNDVATTSETEMIAVFSPQESEEISSPVTISGEARGMWYFEADFPVEITDNAGNTLGTAPATAQGDWMTEDLVPFSAEIPFDAAAAQTQDGRIILRRANPSGLPENDDSIEVPVTFNEEAEAATTSIQVFWNDDAAAVAGDCSVVQSFSREIPETQAVGQAAITALLDGPVTSETSAGFSTNIPDDVELNSLRIEDGVAYVDFSSELNQVGGSCRVQAIRAQITQTLQQFSTVDSVEISVDGSTEAVLQP